jgi:hypothetical protein
MQIRHRKEQRIDHGNNEQQGGQRKPDLRHQQFPGDASLRQHRVGCGPEGLNPERLKMMPDFHVRTITQVRLKPAR